MVSSFDKSKEQQWVHMEHQTIQMSSWELSKGNIFTTTNTTYTFGSTADLCIIYFSYGQEKQENFRILYISKTQVTSLRK